MTLTFPLPFAPQRCRDCKQVFELSYLTPISVDERLVGWVCDGCEGEVEDVECAPSGGGDVPASLCLPANRDAPGYSNRHGGYVDRHGWVRNETLTSDAL